MKLNLSIATGRSAPSLTVCSLGLLIVVAACGPRAKAGDGDRPSSQAKSDSAVFVLEKPDAVFPGTFTNLSSMVELGSKRVLAVDGQENEVQLLDFSSGQAIKVGRVGQGPKEYTRVGGVYGVPGGGALLNDPLEWRFLVLDSLGNITGTAAHPGRDGAREGRIPISGQGNSDASGRIYYESSSFPKLAENGLSSSADSIAILRWDRVASSVDTAAWLQIPKMEAFTRSDGEGKSIAISRPMDKAFSAAEAWGVAPDGWVARVTPQPYRVIWYPSNGGAPIIGPVQPYTPLPVTEEDRKAVIDALESQRASISVRSGAARENKGTGSGWSPEFAETKPPFLPPRSFTKAHRVVVSPAGELWVPRSAPAGEKQLTYDVFDRTGKVVRRVRLPAGRGVVGFGDGVVYLINISDDDLQQLERYRMR